MAYYFVRHGETVWNVEHRLQGVHDIPLDETGVRQAEELHRKLAAEGVRFARVYSSPLSRALRTAEIVSGRPEAGIIRDDRLTEIAFGKLEGAVYTMDAAGGRGEQDAGSAAASGQNLPEIAAAMEDFLGRPSQYRPPEGGETFPQVFARARSFLEDLAAREADTPGDILVVSHGGIMHGLLFILEHRTDVDDFWRTKTPNCEALKFERIVL